MVDKLSCIKGPKDVNVVDTIFDEISAESKFYTEMIRMYNNILSNKLDNDDIDNKNNDLNTINFNKGTRKARCTFSSSKQLKKTINKKNISTLIKKTLITKNNNKKKNTETIDDVTHEK